jgi:hypothetical protein
VGTVVFFEGFFTFFVGLASFADIVIAFYMYECREVNRLLFVHVCSNALLAARLHDVGLTLGPSGLSSFVWLVLEMFCPLSLA